MGKLVFLSDIIDKDNHELDSRVRALFDHSSPSVGFIPSCSDPQRIYYNATQSYYMKLGITRFDYFDLDVEYDEEAFSRIFDYEAIHLSGGDTFYFLHLLRKRGIMDSLRSYVSNGGILIGLSAGSILMTRTIGLAGFGEPDSNRCQIEDQSALGLVDFEFCPHWDGTEEMADSIRKYAKANRTIVYAVKDGDGIIVNDGRMELIGEVLRID